MVASRGEDHPRRTTASETRMYASRPEPGRPRRRRTRWGSTTPRSTERGRHPAAYETARYFFCAEGYSERQVRRDAHLLTRCCAIRWGWHSADAAAPGARARAGRDTRPPTGVGGTGAPPRTEGRGGPAGSASRQQHGEDSSSTVLALIKMKGKCSE